LNSIWLRLDFLIFRLFPVSSLFFVRQVIKHGFVLLNSNCIRGSQKVKVGDIVIITKHMYFPKEIIGKNKFPFVSPLFFDVDINFKTQSFVLNSVFITSYARFSSFSGFTFNYDNIKNFYSR
jgi:ribosomal protein S4